MSASPPENSPPRSGRSRKRRDKLIGTDLAGKYTILKKIGEGGMGSVYIANQKPIDRKVAVKVLLSKLAEDEIAVKRFEQEAKAISKMQHPNTVTIYDFGRVEEANDEGGERLYIVMEYLRGATLTQVLRKEGAFPGPRASRIMRQICASLADAHGAGIIHRDLKPDNIFLSELGGEKDFVKVLDFGVAKLADSESAGTLTQTGMIFGTPKYMSPEQAEGKPIDYRADIYALGVVLYELLCGKPPFVADTPVGLLLKHISEPPKPFAEVAAERNVDPRLEAIVMRALEKHPDRRQQQVTELAAELEQYERVVTGPQAIVTDVGRLSGVGPAPTPGMGLPTEVVPGTLPGQPVTPAGLSPPDAVPPDLSAGLGGTMAPQRVTGATANAFTAGQPPTAPGQPVTAPGMTAPVGAAGIDTVGSELSGEYSGQHTPTTTVHSMYAAAGVLTTIALAVTAYAMWPEGSKVEAILPEVEPRAALNTPPPADPAPPPIEPAPSEPSTPGPAATPEGATNSEPPRSRRPQSRRTSPTEGAPTERAPPEKGPPTVAPPSQVILRLASTPAEAVVSLGGRQAGVTPFEYRVPKGDEVLTFVFTKPGYKKVTKVVTSARDRELAVELERLPRRTRPRPKAKTCSDGSAPPCSKKPDAVDLKVDDLK